jgi:hypothetical protein
VWKLISPMSDGILPAFVLNHYMAARYELVPFQITSILKERIFYLWESLAWTCCWMSIHTAVESPSQRDTRGILPVSVTPANVRHLPCTGYWNKRSFISDAMAIWKFLHIFLVFFS